MQYAIAQTPSQEAANGLALYAKTKELGQLDKGRKAIDRIYKTKKDSLSYRTNLLRAMIYSSLALADVKRSLGYKKDPSVEALSALARLRHPKQNEEHQQEIVFVKKKLAAYFTEKANNDLKNENFAGALASYRLVDSLNEKDWKVIHNLAVLNQRLGNTGEAATFYKLLTEDKDHSSPEYFMAFADMYRSAATLPAALSILQKGRERFPDNRDLLFKVINIYADNHQYDAVSSLIDEAEHMDPKNQNLNYLAGFCYQQSGNNDLAEKYYKKVIELNGNNYDANYSLGLLSLNLYLKNKLNEKLQDAQKYLLKALEIEPAGKNALLSLAQLYKTSGNEEQLEIINNKLNKDKFN